LRRWLRAAGAKGAVLKETAHQTADGSLFRVFATNEHARALGTDRFVVGMFMVDREDLSGPVYGSLIVLRDDKGARENEPTDRERMPVLSLCRTRQQVLRFDFRVPVSSKLCLELDLIHVIFHLLQPQLYKPAYCLKGLPGRPEAIRRPSPQRLG
jgi:hypothetical protein